MYNNYEAQKKETLYNKYIKWYLFRKIFYTLRQSKT